MNAADVRRERGRLASMSHRDLDTLLHQLRREVPAAQRLLLLAHEEAKARRRQLLQVAKTKLGAAHGSD